MAKYKYRGLSYRVNRMITKFADITKYNYRQINCITAQRDQWYQEYQKLLEALSRRYDNDFTSPVWIEKYPDEFRSRFANNQTLPQEKIIPWNIDLLRTFNTFLEKHQIEFWIDSGTLLGAYRNSKMIPWDDDIDVGIDNDNLLKLIKATAEDKLSLPGYIMVFKRGRSHEISSPADLMPIWFYNINNLFYHLDVFLYHKAEMDQLRVYWDDCFQCRHHYLTISSSVIYPLKNINFEDNFYHCPNKTAELLTAWYGDLSPVKW